jgi:PAS domain S-box-containing protein
LTRTWTERQRLAALAQYRILDTPAEGPFDDIVRIAASICGVPMASITLVDDHRQWFKAAIGMGVSETPRDLAFCAHTIQGRETLIVNDATLDDRFSHNPLVIGDPKLRFYAGAPLVTADGFPLGALCVLDSRPREITTEQRELLEALARQVMTQLELRQSLSRQRADEARNRLIIESALDYAIVTLDLDGVLTSWNEGAARLFGWPAEEIVGQSFEIVFTAEDRASCQLQAAMATALRVGRADHDRWHVRRDGSRFWASGEIMRLAGEDGEPLGYLKILRDRSEQRTAELKLQHSETRTRLALEAADLGTWEAIPSLGVVHGDERARYLLDHKDDGLIDYERQFLTRIHPSHRELVDRHIREALAPAGSGQINSEYRMFDAEDGRERWVHSTARVVKLPGERRRLIGTVRDISADKAADAHRTLLANELQHRIKNTLAVVQGIVSQSLKTVATPIEARDAIASRLQTLSNAHDMLTRSSWTAVPIRDVVDGATAAHHDGTDRVRMSGPVIKLQARAALALSMVLHELCTNATKYGALSVESGHVAIDWSVSGDQNDLTFDLSWQEEGGPPVSVPKRRGFGSRLIETSFTRNVGSTQLTYASTGVRWTLTGKLAEVQED